ncbi:MAG: hypothetical protein Q9165_000486 [Trypethelium subeluteriae]
MLAYRIRGSWRTAHQFLSHSSQSFSGPHTPTVAHNSCNRTDVDYGTFGRLSGQDMVDGSLAQFTRSSKIESQDPIPSLFVHLANREETVHNGGIVDEKVNLAELADRTIKQGLGGLFRRNITLDG